MLATRKALGCTRSLSSLHDNTCSIGVLITSICVIFPLSLPCYWWCRALYDNWSRLRLRLGFGFRFRLGFLFFFYHFHSNRSRWSSWNISTPSSENNSVLRNLLLKRYPVSIELLALQLLHFFLEVVNPH